MKDVMNGVLTPTMGVERGIDVSHSRGNGHSNGLGNGLDEARDAVQSDDYGKWDALLPREELRLCDGLLTFAHEIGEQQLSPSIWATGQLCTRLGIPAPYYRRCPPELQDIQGNHWLRHGQHKPGERWLLRAKSASGKAFRGNAANGGHSVLQHSVLRAVLSERYSPLDNATLLDELRPLLPAHYRVDWFGLTEESLHLRVVDPQRCREVLPDDALTAGIHLSNSEVGLRSVTVDALVYRLVCTNGLIRLVRGKSLMRQRHLHVSEYRFAGVLSEAIQNALRESEAFLQEMQATTRTPVPDIETVMEKIAEKWHLSDETRDAVKDALKREPFGQQETLFGLVNAYTATAQRLPDDQRYDLEVLAGNLAAHGVAAYAVHSYAARRKKRGAVVESGTVEAGAVDVGGIVGSIEAAAIEGVAEYGSALEPIREPQSPIPTSEALLEAGGENTSSARASIVEMARDIFDAEIVGRVPRETTNATANATANGRPR